MYGAPSQDGTGDVKAAVHFSTERAPDAWSADEVATTLAEVLPELGTRHTRSAECWYTLTPDEHFVVGPHPASPRCCWPAGSRATGSSSRRCWGGAGGPGGRRVTRHDLATFDPTRFAG
jgi:sarcosine oxidase